MERMSPDDNLHIESKNTSFYHAAVDNNILIVKDSCSESIKNKDTANLIVSSNDHNSETNTKLDILCETDVHIIKSKEGLREMENNSEESSLDENGDDFDINVLCTNDNWSDSHICNVNVVEFEETIETSDTLRSSNGELENEIPHQTVNNKCLQFEIVDELATGREAGQIPNSNMLNFVSELTVENSLSPGSTENLEVTKKLEDSDIQVSQPHKYEPKKHLQGEEELIAASKNENLINTDISDFSNIVKSCQEKTEALKNQVNVSEDTSSSQLLLPPDESNSPELKLLVEKSNERMKSELSNENYSVESKIDLVNEDCFDQSKIEMEIDSYNSKCEELEELDLPPSYEKTFDNKLVIECIVKKNKVDTDINVSEEQNCSDSSNEFKMECDEESYLSVNSNKETSICTTGGSVSEQNTPDDSCHNFGAVCDIENNKQKIKNNDFEEIIPGDKKPLRSYEQLSAGENGQFHKTYDSKVEENLAEGKNSFESSNQCNNEFEKNIGIEKCRLEEKSSNQNKDKSSYQFNQECDRICGDSRLVTGSVDSSNDENMDTTSDDIIREVEMLENESNNMNLLHLQGNTGKQSGEEIKLNTSEGCDKKENTNSEISAANLLTGHSVTNNLSELENDSMLGIDVESESGKNLNHILEPTNKHCNDMNNFDLNESDSDESNDLTQCEMEAMLNTDTSDSISLDVLSEEFSNDNSGRMLVINSQNESDNSNMKPRNIENTIIQHCDEQSKSSSPNGSTVDSENVLSNQSMMKIITNHNVEPTEDLMSEEGIQQKIEDIDPASLNKNSDTVSEKNSPVTEFGSLVNNLGNNTSNLENELTKIDDKITMDPADRECGELVQSDAHIERNWDHKFQDHNKITSLDSTPVKNTELLVSETVNKENNLDHKAETDDVIKNSVETENKDLVGESIVIEDKLNHEFKDLQHNKDTPFTETGGKQFIDETVNGEIDQNETKREFISESMDVDHEENSNSSSSIQKSSEHGMGEPSLKKKKLLLNLMDLDDTPLSVVLQMLKECKKNSSSGEIIEKKRYNCNYCEETFSRQVTKEAHEKEHLMLYKCVSCHSSFQTHLKLLKHRSEVHDDHPYYCSFCSTSSPNVHTWNRHMKTCHVRCSRCKSYFRDLEDVKTHNCLSPIGTEGEPNRIQYDFPNRNKRRGRPKKVFIPSLLKELKEKDEGGEDKQENNDHRKVLTKKNYYLLKKLKLLRQSKFSSATSAGSENPNNNDENKKRGPFSCVHCEESFEDKSALICHQGIVHPRLPVSVVARQQQLKKVMVCKYCLTFFNTVEDRAKHVCRLKIPRPILPKSNLQNEPLKDTSGKEKTENKVDERAKITPWSLAFNNPQLTVKIKREKETSDVTRQVIKKNDIPIDKRIFNLPDVSVKVRSATNTETMNQTNLNLIKHKEYIANLKARYFNFYRQPMKARPVGQNIRFNKPHNKNTNFPVMHKPLLNVPSVKNRTSSPSTSKTTCENTETSSNLDVSNTQVKIKIEKPDEMASVNSTSACTTAITTTTTATSNFTNNNCSKNLKEQTNSVPTRLFNMPHLSVKVRGENMNLNNVSNTNNQTDKLNTVPSRIFNMPHLSVKVRSEATNQVRPNINNQHLNPMPPRFFNFPHPSVKMRTAPPGMIHNNMYMNKHVPSYSPRFFNYPQMPGRPINHNINPSTEHANGFPNISQPSVKVKTEARKVEELRETSSVHSHPSFMNFPQPQLSVRPESQLLNPNHMYKPSSNEHLNMLHARFFNFHQQHLKVRADLQNMAHKNLYSPYGPVLHQRLSNLPEPPKLTMGVQNSYPRNMYYNSNEHLPTLQRMDNMPPLVKMKTECESVYEKDLYENDNITGHTQYNDFSEPLVKVKCEKDGVVENDVGLLDIVENNAPDVAENNAPDLDENSTVKVKNKLELSTDLKQGPVDFNLLNPSILEKFGLRQDTTL